MELKLLGLTLLLTTLLQGVAQAELLTPYSENELTDILKTVQIVLTTDDITLHSSKGPYKAQVLWQKITPGDTNIPRFIGYGNSVDEASTRAGFICIKWKCSSLNAEKDNSAKTLESYSYEKLMDVLRAAGRNDLVNEKRDIDKEEYRQWILKSMKDSRLTCDNPKNPMPAVYTYISCMGSGFDVIKR